MAFLHRKLLFDINGTANNEFQPEPPCDYSCNSWEGSADCIRRCGQKCPTGCLDESTPPLLTYHHADETKKIIILTVSIVVSIFVLAFLILRYTKLCSRSRSRSRSIQEPRARNEEFLDEDQGPIVEHPIWYIRTVGLDPAVINSIAVCRFKKGDGLVEGTDCSVCLSEFQEDETLRLLPKCSHAFHLPCIDTWLRSHTNCPLCRAPIISTASPAASSSSSGANTRRPEETRIAIPEENEEFEHEISNPNIENGSEDGERQDRSENNDVSDANAKMQVRRSISLDSLSALKIRFDLLCQERNNSNSADNRSEKGTESSNSSRSLVRNSSSRSLARNSSSTSLARNSSSTSLARNSLPIFLKRSFSCSGKALPTRHSRSRRDRGRNL